MDERSGPTEKKKIKNSAKTLEKKRDEAGKPTKANSTSNESAATSLDSAANDGASAGVANSGRTLKRAGGNTPDVPADDGGMFVAPRKRARESAPDPKLNKSIFFGKTMLSAYFEDDERKVLHFEGLVLNFCEEKLFKNGWVHMLHGGATIPRDGRHFHESKFVYKEGSRPELPVSPLIDGQPLVEPLATIPSVRRAWVLDRKQFQIGSTHFVMLHVLWSQTPLL